MSFNTIQATEIYFIITVWEYCRVRFICAMDKISSTHITFMKFFITLKQAFDFGVIDDSAHYSITVV
jgi:hypothetical protein